MSSLMLGVLVVGVAFLAACAGAAFVLRKGRIELRDVPVATDDP